ncbi:MAG: hypothetical protein GY847_01470 [Proteobacteria bacterium]|nr:hypothetical protein [Pseudomonadota bacterium]
MRDGLRNELLEIGTMEEVEELFDLLKMRHKELRNREGNTVRREMNLKVGDKVQFTGRKNITRKGTVRKINKKNAIIAVPIPGFGPDDGNQDIPGYPKDGLCHDYSVPFSMLRPISD